MIFETTVYCCFPSFTSNCQKIPLTDKSLKTEILYYCNFPTEIGKGEEGILYIPLSYFDQLYYI